MKTKPFLLATAGSTVDGRNIDDAMLEQMASSYDTKTYGARLNIEHIRGISGDGPFRAYGDVVELSVGEVDVNFNGQTEKRKALFGVLDVNDDAKKLNEANQKLYPSIEIEPNFAGKGFAYLMGCALTDSPASIGTERMQFNRQLPGTLNVHGQDAASLEFPEAAPAADAAATEVKGFFSKLTELLSGTAPKQEPVQQPQQSAAPGQFDPVQFTKDLGDTLGKAFATQDAANKAAIDALTAQVTALSQQIENTQHPGHQNRPPANGANGANFRAEF